MNKSERLLGIVADSLNMPGWNDGLSSMVDSISDKPATKRILSLDDLAHVAGGVPMDVSYDPDLAKRLIDAVINK